MRVFTVEIRRLLKTRSVLVLMLAALILAPVLAYFPASFASWTYRDESGQEVRVEGREALKLEEENQGQFQGKITEETLAAALARYRDFAAGYEGGLPDGIYDERVTAEAEERLIQASKICDDVGVESKTLMVKSFSPAEAIIEQAEKNACDIIFNLIFSYRNVTEIPDKRVHIA